MMAFFSGKYFITKHGKLVTLSSLAVTHLQEENRDQVAPPNPNQLGVLIRLTGKMIERMSHAPLLAPLF